MLLSGVATAALVLLTVWLFDLSLDRAAVLAPVIVVVTGAAAGLVVLWTRVGWEAIRGRQHRWLIVAGALGVIALLVVLSALGLRLPRE